MLNYLILQKSARVDRWKCEGGNNDGMPSHHSLIRVGISGEPRVFQEGIKVCLLLRAANVSMQSQQTQLIFIYIYMFIFKKYEI